MNKLKQKYKGKKCLVLGCGPSLRDVGYEKIAKLSEEYVVATIKQSYLQFKDKAEMQFFNCNNFMEYKGDNVNFICCSPFPLEAGRSMVWEKQQIDFFYQIKNNVKFGEHSDLESYFSEDNLGTFRGPGIMFEIVLPFLYNSGFKEILTIGWDYHAGEGQLEHFYKESNRARLKNPAHAPYFGENKESIENSAKVQRFFKEKGITLRCAKSPKCYLDESIIRVEI